jgi:tetratricopeptide (TPR) repeat protein
MVDRHRLLRQAEQLVTQGKLQSAVQIYESLLKDRPDDTSVLNTVGDLYIRLGKGEAGLPYFKKAAEQFNNAGFFKKAIATLRKAHRQKPTDSDMVELLASLHVKEGLASEAKTLLMELARHHQITGNLLKAREVYLKVLEIDPHHMPARLKLSEIAASQGDTKAEFKNYVAIGRELITSGRLDEALKFLTQTYEANPKQAEVAGLLADLQVRMGNLQGAGNLYKKLLSANPENAEFLAGFGALELEKGNEAQAVKLFHKAHGVDPKNDRVLLLGGKIAFRRKELDTVIRYLDPLIEKVLVSGEKGPVVDSLEDIAQKFPNHVTTLKKLETIYTYLEAKPKLLSALERLAAACEQASNFEGAIEAVEKLASFEPEKLAHKNRLNRLHSRSHGTEMFSDGEAVSVPAPFESPEEEAPAETSPHDEVNAKSKEVLLEIDVLLRYGLQDKAKQRIQTALEELPDSAMLHHRLADLFRAEDNSKAAIDHYSKASELWEGQGNHEQSIKLQQVISELALAEEPEEVKPVESVEGVSEGGPAASEGPRPSEDPIDDQLAEAEYYLDQGFLSPAHQILTELKGSYPDHQKVKELWENLRSQVGLKLDEDKVEEELDDIFDNLAGEKTVDDLSSLADELQDELFQLHSAAERRLDVLSGVEKKPDVERLLSHLPPGASPELTKEDMRIHLELGLAYHETGLIEEAITELQLSAEDPTLRPRSCLHLGCCFHQIGMDDLALDWLKKGLEGSGEVSIQADTLHQMVLIYKKLGKMGDLVTTLKKLKGIAPNHPGLVSPMTK